MSFGFPAVEDLPDILLFVVYFLKTDLFIQIPPLRFSKNMGPTMPNKTHFFSQDRSSCLPSFLFSIIYGRFKIFKTFQRLATP